MNLKWEATLASMTIIAIVLVVLVSGCTISSPSGRKMEIDGAALSGVIDSAGSAAGRLKAADTSNNQRSR